MNGFLPDQPCLHPSRAGSLSWLSPLPSFFCPHPLPLLPSCLPFSLLFSFFPSSPQRRHIFPREHPSPRDLSGPTAQNPALGCLADGHLFSPGASSSVTDVGPAGKDREGPATHWAPTTPATLAIPERILEAAGWAQAAPWVRDSCILGERWLLLATGGFF